jgi:hypothetical protein
VLVEPEATPWFSVRLILRLGGQALTTYQERITVWRACDFDAAIALATDEAADYGEPIGADHLGLAQAYQLFDQPGHGAEIFSLMRDSALTPEEYLAAFFATGTEREHAADTNGESDD